MSKKEIDILKRALIREKSARKSAEKILEDKSAILYNTTQELYIANKKLEELVKEKTSELQGVFENIIDAYVVMDLWGNVLKMNDAAKELLELDNTDGDINLLELTDKSEIKNVMSAFEELKKEGSVTNVEVNINTKSNTQKLVHINGSIILDDNGKPIAAQGIVRDITKIRLAEEQLIESENRLAALIRNLDAGVLLENEDRKIVLTNSKFCELFNIPVAPEFLIGQDCTDSAEQSKNQFTDPDEFVSRIDEIVKARKLVVGDELSMTNGIILERDYIPIFKNEYYKGHLWKYRDVTLNHSYRKSLELQQDKYRSIIANMNLGLIEVSNEDEIIMANEIFSEMSGYSKEELIGKKGHEFLTEGDETDVISLENSKRQKGKYGTYELKVKTKSGTIKNWLISGAPNYNLQGEVIGSVGIHLDITGLKKLQFQKEKLLIELEKRNEELQEYAHIVSHDLKSPLRSIYALVNWIKEDNIEVLNENSLQNITQIEDTLQKMEQLISDILNYSSVGSGNLKMKRIDTNILVKELIQILYIPDHVTIKIKRKLPVVKGDKIKLQQLFQNLISNAVKFIDKKEGQIEIDYKSLKNKYQFSIRDNGIGIESRYHDKIFKIFHSLNKSKDSSGIGLSIVKKVIELHSGKIWLESSPNEGTTFFFTLKKF